MEMEAEKWAQKMRERGIAVPRKMPTRAKAYAGLKIAAAIARGAKGIDPKARRFADYGRARQRARRRAYARQQERRCS